MRISVFHVLSLLTLAAAVQAAQNAGAPPAGARAQQGVDERFKLMDTNKDGKLSQAEYLAGGNVATGAAGNGNGSGNAAAGQRQGETAAVRTDRFKAMDTNKDGSVSLDEYKANRATRTPGGPQGGAQPRGART